VEHRDGRNDDMKDVISDGVDGNSIEGIAVGGKVGMNDDDNAVDIDVGINEGCSDEGLEGIDVRITVGIANADMDVEIDVD